MHVWNRRLCRGKVELFIREQSKRIFHVINFFLHKFYVFCVLFGAIVIEMMIETIEQNYFGKAFVSEAPSQQL